MKRQWANEELVEHWSLDVEDRALLGNKTGATRLGFAVLLKFFRQEGRFPQYKHEVPGIVITYLATQVGVAPEAYLQYAWQGRTIEYHRPQIREALGFRESTVADAEEVTAWLVEQVLPREHHEERLRDMAYQRFRALQLEAPTPNRITRVIRSARHTFEQQLYETTLARLPKETQTALDALLEAEEHDEGEHDEGVQVVTLQELRMDPSTTRDCTRLLLSSTLISWWWVDDRSLETLMFLEVFPCLFPGFPAVVPAPGKGSTGSWHYG